MTPCCAFRFGLLVTPKRPSRTSVICDAAYPRGED
jgi:hypothetical protein